MAINYPDSKHHDSLTLGQQYQAFIADLFASVAGIGITYYTTREQQYNIGESVEGYEIKLDQPCTNTGRLAIEIGEKSRKSLAAFTPSGIMRKDNTLYYVQGNYVRVWCFKKATLQNLYWTMHPHIVDDNPPTSQLFYLPIREANSLMDFAITIPSGRLELNERHAA